MQSAELALARLCSPEAAVSVHYLIAKDGEVYQLVEDENKAWHAGVSHWAGKDGLNDDSIGIELDNNGYEQFPEAQLQALLELGQGLAKKHKIQPLNILSHSEIAYARKTDPSHHLDWKWLAVHGFALFPEVIIKDEQIIFKPHDVAEGIVLLKKMLANYGFFIKDYSNEFGIELAKVVIAFKRRFAPNSNNFYWDNVADARLKALLNVERGENESL
jgi:N-acetylmuramoyl-L-alanine amidase